MINYPAQDNKLPVSFDAWKLLVNDKAELIRLTLKPGESIEPHENHVPAVFYCISGKGSITIGEERHKIVMGGAVFIASGLSRGLVCESVEGLEVVVVKVMGF